LENSQSGFHREWRATGDRATFAANDWPERVSTRGSQRQTGKDERRHQAKNDQASSANEHGRAPLSILTGELCHKKAQKAQKAQKKRSDEE
jgi:hypothetical protein